jgi:hypothetical protein
MKVQLPKLSLRALRPGGGKRPQKLHSAAPDHGNPPTAGDALVHAPHVSASRSNAVASDASQALQRPTLPKGPAINGAMARLLASMEDAHRDGEFPDELMSQHLARLAQMDGPHQEEFAKASDALAFSGEISRLTKSLDGNFLGDLDRSARTVSDKVLTRLNQRGSALFQLNSFEHSMMMEIVKETDAQGRSTGLATIRLYNTGDGLQRHTARENGKYQTAYEVRGVPLGNGPNQLGREELSGLLRNTVYYLNMDIRFADASAGLESVYDRITELGTPHNPPEGLTQAEQKVGNCSHKGVLAYMRRNMSDPAFATARTLLLEDAADQFSTQVAKRRKADEETFPKRSGWFKDFVRKARFKPREHAYQDDVKLLHCLMNKAVEARKKLTRANDMQRTRNEGVGKPWFSSNDKAAVSESLRRGHANLKAPLFSLRYAADTRQWILSTVRDNNGTATLEHTPLVYDRDTGEFRLSRHDESFANLDDFAAHMEVQGLQAHNVAVEAAPTHPELADTLRAKYMGFPFFLGAANTAQVERSLRRQDLSMPSSAENANPNGRTGKYLLSYDPNRTQWTFSYGYHMEDGKVDLMHYPMEFDTYARQFTVPLPNGEVRGSDPMAVVSALVQRASKKIDLIPGDLDV